MVLWKWPFRTIFHNFYNYIETNSPHNASLTSGLRCTTVVVPFDGPMSGLGISGHWLLKAWWRYSV